MKVKDITLREAEITTKPMPGATELDVNGKSVGVAHDAQTAQMISQAAKDGKLSLGATPDGTQPGQQTNNLGEEPGSSEAYQVKPGPQPMAMTSPKPTAIVASKIWTAITPEIAAKAQSQGFRKVFLQWNRQQVPGLEGGDQQLGSKIIVSPQDFHSMSTPGAATMRRGMGISSAEKTGSWGDVIPPKYESAELDSIKKLSGL